MASVIRDLKFWETGTLGYGVDGLTMERSPGAVCFISKFSS